MSLDADDHCESRYLLAGSADATLSIYDVGRIDARTVLDQRTEGRTVSELQEYEERIAAAEAVRLRSPLFRSVRARIDDGGSHKFSVSCVSWSPLDTGMFASSDLSGRLIVWDTNTGAPVVSFPPARESSGILALQFTSPTTIACSTTTGELLQYDLLSPPLPIRSLQASMSNATSLCAHPRDHNIIATAGGRGDGTIRLFDLRRSGTSAFLVSCSYESTSMSMSKVGKGNVRVKQHAPIDTRHLAKTILAPADPMGICDIKWTPCGNHLLSLSYSPSFTLWDFRPTLMSTPTSVELRNPSSYSGSAPVLGDRFDRPIRLPYSYPIAPPTQTHPTSPPRFILSGSGRSLHYHTSYSTSTIYSHPIFSSNPCNDLIGHITPALSIAAQGNGTIWTGGADGMILGWGRCEVKVKDTVPDVDTW